MPGEDTTASERTPRFLALPTTELGKWSSWLLLTAVVLVLANTIVVMPYTESHRGLDAAQMTFNVAVGVFVLGAGVAGLLGIVLRHERSWPAVLATALLAVVLVMMAQDLLTPG